jgi:hypothetical protein
MDDQESENQIIPLECPGFLMAKSEGHLVVFSIKIKHEPRMAARQENPIGAGSEPDGGLWLAALLYLEKAPTIF